MTEKNKMYLTPEIEVVELENENILCSSQMEQFRDGGDWTWDN